MALLELVVQQQNIKLFALEGNKQGITMAMVNPEYPAEWSLKTKNDYEKYAQQKFYNLQSDNEVCIR